jgi:hypothetical protein
MVQINVKKIVQAENSQKRKRRRYKKLKIRKIKNRMEANCWKSLYKWYTNGYLTISLACLKVCSIF